MENTTSEIIYSIITFALFVLLLVVALILLFLNYLKNKNQLIKENETIKAQYEQTILQTQVEIQEQVFTQISQEIHDNIGQVLSLVRININTLGQPVNEMKLRQTDQLLGKAIQDLRSLSHTLSMDYINEVGLIEALRQLMTSLERTGQFSTRFVSPTIFLEIDKERSLILFRIVQEVINNIIRHANATGIELTIAGCEQVESIVISDNGCGFDTNNSYEGKSGLGITNMKKRASLIGVIIHIESTLNIGTKVTLFNQTN